jgi:lipopolysaccharide/colanic/teichoic acid biosynthesis glycosyltransferase/carbonic anhydrase/acetyltransferase-like protein (isoleucine patch superfamily)
LPPVPPSQISFLDAGTYERVSELLSKQCAKVIVKHAISFRSGAELLVSQRRLMRGEFAGLQIGGRQSEKGVWISRNVSIHPTASLQAPVYIGPNCRIGQGSRVGPCAVISENCILDSLSSVENSVIASGTYIGRGLELNQVLVDRNLLVNVKIGTSFTASETFLLSGLMGHTRYRPLQRIVSFLGALTLFIVFLPAAVLIYFYMTVSRSGALYFERAVSIPADDNPSSWREYFIPRFFQYRPEQPTRWALFFFQFWPGLLSVIHGDLLLVGLQPRTRAAVCGLPNDWKSLYLKARAGLITEAFVMFGDCATEDEVYTAEAYYSATETTRHDLKLAFLYLRNLILMPGRIQGDSASDSLL